MPSLDGSQPCGLAAPVHRVVQPGSAALRKTSNEHGRRLETVSVDSYERRKRCCVISSVIVAEPHRGRVGTLLLPAAHPSMSMLALGPVCLDTSPR